MTDTQGTAPVPVSSGGTDLRTLALVIYGLYIAAVFSCGVAGVIGVIVAYVKRDDARGTLWESHFENQITAFWVWFLLFAGGVALFWTVIAPIVLIGGAFIYFLYRTIKGLIRALDAQPYV